MYAILSRGLDGANVEKPPQAIIIIHIIDARKQYWNAETQRKLMNAVKSSVNRVANLIINKITPRKLYLTWIINHHRWRCHNFFLIFFLLLWFVRMCHHHQWAPFSMEPKNRTLIILNVNVVVNLFFTFAVKISTFSHSLTQIKMRVDSYVN